MSEPSPSPEPYHVVYSEYVRNAFRNLLALAKSRGLGSQVAAAARMLHKRLCIYPQFGDPLRDLELKPGNSGSGASRRWS